MCLDNHVIPDEGLELPWWWFGGITAAGYYKVQPLPLQTLPFAQPDFKLRRIRHTHLGIDIIFHSHCSNQSQNINGSPAAHAVTYLASSELMKCRLLKLLLDHPMKHTHLCIDVLSTPNYFIIICDRCFSGLTAGFASSSLHSHVCLRAEAASSKEMSSKPGGAGSWLSS